MAKAYPDDYVPYLALGDMYAQTGEFERAESNYQKAYKLAPQNPVIIANAANTAIEARQIKLAGEWVDRATGKMNDDPRVMRERERYLFHEGNYQESARLGYKVLQQLPKDRNASVYLDYDLYNLGRFDDALVVANQYGSQLPKEPNFPLLAGHVHKRSQLLNEAIDDYTQAIARDPKMVEAYVNRGYVRRAEVNGRIGRDAPSTRHRLSATAFAGQCREGISRRPEICPQRFDAATGAGRHAVRHAPLSAVD